MGVNKESKELIREVMREIIAENQIMPVPDHICQVTEIIIRCGPPEAIVTIGGGQGGTPCVPCCRPHPGYTASFSSYTELGAHLNDETKNMFQQIMKAKGYTKEGLLRILANRISVKELSMAISEYAGEMGIKQT